MGGLQAWCKEYLVISDNVCQEGEELDLNSHKVHVSLLVEVGACSEGEEEGEAVTIIACLSCS